MTLQHPSKDASVMDAITEVIINGRLCVLATILDNGPYTSLMRYLADDRGREIHLVTHKNTTKYKNILKNPRVSLLMDTRMEDSLSGVQALSIDGVAHPVTDKEKAASLCDQFISRHPDIAEFVRHPDAAVICVDVQEFLFLNGIQDAHRLKVAP